MHPILFEIGPLTIYSYGVTLAIGFIIGITFAARKAEAAGVDQSLFYTLAIYMLIFGIFGARALYVANDWSYFSDHPLEIFMLWRGGLVFYGALVGGILGAAGYLKHRGVKALFIADIIAPYIALGESIGRIGCLLNGCCYGTNALFNHFQITFGYLGIRFPVQILASALNLILFVVLIFQYKRRRFDGEIFALYLAGYGVLRFLTEFLRGDNVAEWGGLRISQWISAGIVITGFVVWIYAKKYAASVHHAKNHS